MSDRRCRPFWADLATHLRKARVPFSPFGRTMETWATGMPVRMMLKSEGFASIHADPDAAF